MQVDKTPGLLLEKPTPLETYVEKGWELVTIGFKPFFPTLTSMSVPEQADLKHKFCAKASTIGKSMTNEQGMVEDKHTNLWVTANAH